VKLIVGLGNPGRQYVTSRHNVGYRCIDQLAQKWNILLSDRRKYAVSGTGEMEGEKVLLGKPRTFMNHSGEGVRYLLDRFRAETGDLVILHDDMDLPLGTIRLRAKGSSAGQRGIASIIACLGSQDFPRIRIGIDKPDFETDPRDHVLNPFTGQERKVVRKVIGRVGDAIECLLRDGIDMAMNRFNSRAGNLNSLT